MSDLVLYGAAGCHLCDEAEAVLGRLAAEIGFTWRKCSIDGDPALEARYRAEIPVLVHGDAKLAKYRLEPESLRRQLRSRGLGLH